MDLFSSVTELRGIGPTRAKQLQRLHIETLYDLIAFFPRAYEDRTKISSIAGLEPGIPACFEAMVISNPQLSRLASVEFARLWCTNYARSRGAFFLPGKRQLFRQLRRTAEAVLRGSSYSAAGASVSEASSTTAASCAARRASLISLASA